MTGPRHLAAGDSTGDGGARRSSKSGTGGHGMTTILKPGSSRIRLGHWGLSGGALELDRSNNGDGRRGFGGGNDYRERGEARMEEECVKAHREGDGEVEG